MMPLIKDATSAWLLIFAQPLVSDPVSSLHNTSVPLLFDQNTTGGFVLFAVNAVKAFLTSSSIHSRLLASSVLTFFFRLLQQFGLEQIFVVVLHGCVGMVFVL